MDDTVQKNILRELKSIKRLLACNLLSGRSQAQNISKLDSVGFKPTEIAEILGTTSNTVNVALNRLRKSDKQNSPPAS